MKKLSPVFFIWLFILALGHSAQAAIAPTVKLSLLADDDKFVVGETVKVRAYLKATDLVNVASGYVVFDPSVFQISKIDKSKSIANLWMFEPKATGTPGSIKFGAAMVYPGFEGEGELFSFDLKVKVATTTNQIKFAEEQIFSADGSGATMKISTSSYSVIFNSATSSSKTGFNKFVVKSFTHEENQWSNKTRASFYWPADYKAAFSFNTLPKADPGKGKKTQTNANYNITKDGTYYFHLRVFDKTGASKLIHYKIKIDTKKPTSFTVSKTLPKKKGGTLVLKIKATDGLSGLSYYDVVLDDKAKKITTGAYSVAVNTSGPHRLAIRVFDKAGNYQENLSSFTIN